MSAPMTYRPRIRSQVGPRWNSITGWIDLSASGTDLRWWECEGHGARGDGSTPKEAYARWYADFIRENQHGDIFITAYRCQRILGW